MTDVAGLLARVVKDKEPPEEVKRDVMALKRDYNTIHYCYQEGTEAYRLWKLG